MQPSEPGDGHYSCNLDQAVHVLGHCVFAKDGQRLEQDEGDAKGIWITAKAYEALDTRNLIVVISLSFHHFELQ